MKPIDKALITLTTAFALWLIALGILPTYVPDFNKEQESLDSLIAEIDKGIEETERELRWQDSMYQEIDSMLNLLDSVLKELKDEL